GVRKPILLLEGFFVPADLAPIARHALSVVVHSHEQMAMLESVRPTPPLAVFLKVNTGMNRLGIPVDQIRGALTRLAATGSVADITLMTHFADADGPEGVTAQLARFEAATRGLAVPRSLANSAALLRHPQTRADWVRPGIMLYGCSPFADESAQALGLKPVMTLTSELIAVRHLAAGERVGYGGTFTADRAMRIGVVACGYADGYPRHAPTGTPILVAGRRTRTLGRVSMDMLAVDLEGIPEAGIGTPVTLWGDGLSCDEVAAAAGTVSYELLCALAARVPQTERA
ncbi:MAG TPA: alanine racemase, partial [Burkholderiales bacterium]|nr:alanine racemase [Burkholderiales bacterium]